MIGFKSRLLWILVRIRILLTLTNSSFIESRLTEIFSTNNGGLGNTSLSASEIDIVKEVLLYESKSKC